MEALEETSLLPEGRPWGYYAPPRAGRYLLGLIKLGFGRGKLRKVILARWRKQFGDIVDVHVRGVNYRLELSDNVTDTKIFAASKVYDGPELAALSHAAKGGVFVDIGANTGYYTLSVAQAASCQVIAIEPNPVTLARLKFNIDVNPNLATRITVIEAGIGEAGEFELYFADSLGGASLNSSLFREGARSVKINTRPLQEVLHDQGIEHVAALKIDIEGAEDGALVPFFKAAPKALWPKALVIEDTHQHLWSSDLMENLKACGYKLSARNGGNAIWER